MMTDHQNTPPHPALHARRCWINQPSAEDAGHQYHGSNVLALPSGPDTYEAYFLSGDTMSRTVPACWLREGWEVAPPAPGAALQQVAVPDGYVLMPVQLTAENGAKGALMGEFTVTREMHCSVCDYDDTDETCEVCGGEVEYVEHVSVPWDSIKEIYNAAVKVCGKQVTFDGEPRLSQPLAELLCRYRGHLASQHFPGDEDGERLARWTAIESQRISAVLKGLDVERMAFEGSVKPRSVERYPNERYVDPFVAGAWSGWQARADWHPGEPAAGFALVPVEPTVDMLIAGQEEWAQGRRGALEDCEEAAAIYRAMIAAVPVGPDDDQQALPAATKPTGTK